MKAELEKTLSTQPRDHWLELFLGAGLAAGPVRGLGDVLEDEQLQHRKEVEVRSMQHKTEKRAELGFARRGTRRCPSHCCVSTAAATATWQAVGSGAAGHPPRCG